jgi:uncharacterized lipoprotein NlpE involved in copper resistance
MEPVKALVEVPFNGTLDVLDQDGSKVVAERSFRRTFGVDGAIDKTPFYLVKK